LGLNLAEEVKQTHLSQNYLILPHNLDF
jgi:hypothetical protein